MQVRTRITDAGVIQERIVVTPDGPTAAPSFNLEVPGYSPTGDELGGGGGGGSALPGQMTINLSMGISGQYLHHSYLSFPAAVTITSIKYVAPGVPWIPPYANAFTSPFGGVYTYTLLEGGPEPIQTPTSDPVYLYVRKNSHTGDSVIQSGQYDLNLGLRATNTLYTVPLSATVDVGAAEKLFIGVECPTYAATPGLNVLLLSGFLSISYVAQ